MDLFTVSFNISETITRGLANGFYTRIGGGINEATTGRAIAFLREAGGLDRLVAQVIDVAGGAAGLGVLNLALSTMGFALVSKRLSGIEDRLQRVQEVLQQVNAKLDLSFYANFRAALDLASNAFIMSSPASRDATALQAANRLAEARHHYVSLADEELAAGTQLAGEYLSTLSLACVAEAACYLQLEELPTAGRILETGLGDLDARARRYTRLLLTSNPAAYLHPSLKEEISLRRVANVMRWLDPAVDEQSLLEEQRANLFQLSEQTEQWVTGLPPAVWDLKLHGQPLAGGAFRRFFGGGDATGVYKRLPETMSVMESLIEDVCRLQTYRVEVETVRRAGITFREWRQLAPPPGAAGPQASLICITPRNLRIKATAPPRVRALPKRRVREKR